MAPPPPWILLQRNVRFVRGEEAPTRSTQAPKIADQWGELTLEEEADAMAAYLEAMKPDPQLFAPPAINRLSMVQQMDARHKLQQIDGVRGGLVSSTDKSLVLLYAGDYIPGFSSDPLSGCYLVYDASSNSVSAIPQLPDPHSFLGLGLGAAIRSTGTGTYMVAELVGSVSGFPNGVLFLWQSCSRMQDGQWTRRWVRLPREFSLDYFFRIDKAFTHGDSQICWVDLLKGVLICNLQDSAKPKFTFVKLPMGCSIDDRHRPRAEEFRTMSSVGGAIKFATLHGYNEELPCEKIKLETWTLSHDLKTWVSGSVVCVSDLSSDFAERNLPMVTPSFPVLSMDKPEVVYLVLNEFDRVDTVDRLGYVCGVQDNCKAQYVIGLDTVRKVVLCDTKSIPDSMTLQFSTLIATEFTASLQRSMEGGLEASEAVGKSLNLMKHAREPRGSKKRRMH